MAQTKIRLGGQTDLDTAGADITGLPTTPGGSNAAASKAYVDAVATGLVIKASVDAADVGANIALTGNYTLDDVALTNGMRVLARNQTTSKDSGIYVVAAGAWARASDMAAASDQYGNYCFVKGGTANKGKGYVQTTDGLVGTDTQTWVEFYQIPSAVVYTGSDGVKLTVADFSIDDTVVVRNSNYKAGIVANETPLPPLKVFTFGAPDKLLTDSISVYLNGQLQTKGGGADYTVTDADGGEITFDVAPEAVDIITATYLIDTTP